MADTLAGDMYEAVQGYPERQLNVTFSATPENRFYEPLVAPDLVLYTASSPLYFTFKVSSLDVSEFQSSLHSGLVLNTKICICDNLFMGQMHLPTIKIAQMGSLF